MKKGYTLMHEHFTIDLSGIKNDEDSVWTALRSHKKSCADCMSLG